MVGKTELPEVIKDTYINLLASEKVQQGLSFIHGDHDQTIKEQIAITEIPAPPFKEAERADDFFRRLEALNLEGVKKDAEGNVFGIRKGTSSNGPKLLVTAHLDTVFPEGTDTSVTEKEGILFAPGIGDDTRGVAELLAVIRALNAAAIETEGDIIFCGTVGEEGAGDLRGVKAFFKENDDIDGFISMDGPGFDRITYLGTGSYRYRITYKGPGGHSFGAFGTPSATHALGRSIAAIADLETPVDPKTTFSVGEVSGGTSVNAIAQEATMSVDLRSNDQQALDELEEEFFQIVKRAAEEENKRWEDDRLIVEIERFGNRPPGSQDPDSTIVQTARGAVESIGGNAQLCDPSSTDANYPISIGVPAITIGLGGEFGSAHTLEEWHDPAEGHLGVQKSYMTILGLAGAAGVSRALLEKRK